MKYIFLLFLIELSLTYNPSAAILYARKYCNTYHPYYDYYQEGDAAHFVSQCLVAGGLSFKGCNGLNNKGFFYRVPDLASCLIKIGWKHTKGMTKQFKKGFPFFIGNYHVMIATEVNGNSVTYCAHTIDRCDYTMKADSTYIYYYL